MAQIIWRLFGTVAVREVDPNLCPLYQAMDGPWKYRHALIEVQIQIMENLRTP